MRGESFFQFLGKASPLYYNLINKVIIDANTTLIITLNNLQQHVSVPKSRLQAEYKGVYIIHCHKMEEISFI
jgi:hypothetical protein